MTSPSLQTCPEMSTRTTTWLLSTTTWTRQLFSTCMSGLIGTGGHWAGSDVSVTSTGPPGVVDAVTLARLVAGFCVDWNSPLNVALAWAATVPRLIVWSSPGTAGGPASQQTAPL